jgi:hypothetical protein
MSVAHSAQIPPSPALTPRRARRFAVCPECQRHQVVRKDGLIGKHRNVWTDSAGHCLGAETTPIPVPVADWDDYPENAGKVLERWDYLSLPLRHLLLMLRAEVREVAAPDLDFHGMAARDTTPRWFEWTLWMPIGQDPLERELLTRGLLAYVHGIDVSDWPVPVGFCVR